MGEELREVRVRRWREYHEEVERKMERRVGVDGEKLKAAREKYDRLKETKTRERQDL